MRISITFRTERYSAENVDLVRSIWGLTKHVTSPNNYLWLFPEEILSLLPGPASVGTYQSG